MSFARTKWWLVGIALVAVGSPVRADVRTKAIQEAAEAVLAKFGSKAGSSLPALTKKIESYVARYGEDMLLAVRRVGPDAFAAVDAAGMDGVKAARVLARHGEEGATCILRRPKAMSQYLQYGDDAAAVLVRHPGVAEPLVERGGQSAVKALGAVTPQNGRRIAMLMEGDLGKAARSPELLDVIAQYGNRATEFIWENKGALAVGTALTAFLADPEPFLNGTKEIVKIGAETTARPLAEGVARGTNWTPVLLVGLAILTGFGIVLAVRFGLIPRSAQWKAAVLPALPNRTPPGQGPQQQADAKVER